MEKVSTRQEWREGSIVLKSVQPLGHTTLLRIEKVKFVRFVIMYLRLGKAMQFYGQRVQGSVWGCGGVNI